MMMQRRRAFADPFVVSVTVLLLLAAAGLAAVGLGWRGAAASLSVSVQITYIVSGVFGGVALLAFALGLLRVQARRRCAALRRADVDRVVVAAARALAAARGGQ
jgi:hypothetical protein